MSPSAPWTHVRRGITSAQKLFFLDVGALTTCQSDSTRYWSNNASVSEYDVRELRGDIPLVFWVVVILFSQTKKKQTKQTAHVSQWSPPTPCSWQSHTPLDGWHDSAWPLHWHAKEGTGQQSQWRHQWTVNWPPPPASWPLMTSLVDGQLPTGPHPLRHIQWHQWTVNLPPAPTPCGMVIDDISGGSTAHRSPAPAAWSLMTSVEGQPPTGPHPLRHGLRCGYPDFC